MMRGAGARGLSGIAPKRDNIIRPLLYSSKKEIIEILDEYNIKHIYPERYTVKDMIDLMFRELNNQG